MPDNLKKVSIPILEDIDPRRQYLPFQIADGKMLNCSTRTVYRLYARGELRGMRVGAGIRIFGWSIIDYIRDHLDE